MRHLRRNICAFREFGRSWAPSTIWRLWTSGQVTVYVSDLGFILLTRPFLQEDSVITDANDDDDKSSEMYCPFELPYDEYGDMMFERRLAMEDSLSPVASRTSRAAESRRGSTVADTDGRHKRTPRLTTLIEY